MTEVSAPPLPSLARRFAALSIDWIMCMLIAGLFARPLVDGWATMAVLVAEYTFFVGLFGQTPGMRLARIGCVHVDTGQPVGLLRAAVRGILLILVVPPLLMDARRRGLHDRAAGTIVIPT